MSAAQRVPPQFIGGGGRFLEWERLSPQEVVLGSNRCQRRVATLPRKPLSQSIRAIAADKPARILSASSRVGNLLMR